jgi:hypothetical protein
MKRTTILAAAAALVATPALGAWAASASSDEAAHLRVADRRGEPEPGDDNRGSSDSDDSGSDDSGHHGGDDGGHHGDDD